MKALTRSLRRGRIAAAVALALCAQPAVSANDPARSFAEMVQTVTLVPAGTYDSEMLAKVSVAVDFIKRMELTEAQLALNAALQLDPRHSYLHFLNGFVYHLQARQGDTQKSELALEGYQQALRIDPSNWIAQEFLGLAYMDLKRFEPAKKAFSEVLLMTPTSERSLYGLMVAAYLTGDAKTACAMADQFLKASDSPPQEFLRSSIPVYASCGSFGRAGWIRAALVQQFGDGPDVERLDRRIAQWKARYDDPTQGAPRALKTRLNPGADDAGSMVLAQAFEQPDGAGYSPSESASSAEGGAVEAPMTDPETGARMLLVDVVLLSTQELLSTSKGVNLLSALTLQLGSVAGNLPAYSRVTSSDGGPSTTTITRAVTIPALSYSLNIANANNSVNEVLARPTLAAIEGLPSEFFSGTNLSAGVVSVSQQGGTTIVPLEKRFGIKLAVTPNFLPQGRVQLKVEAQRTSLNASSDNPRVAYQIEIGETTANANVVMNLGDTLVLSGLSEKSSASTRDGVPGLQDVPGLQYLFSNKRTTELQRSVLILVTPRAPVMISEADAGERESMSARMQRLRERFGFAEHTPANIEAVMTQLDGNDFVREFRQGDVSLERWERVRTTGDRLKEALGFLYY